jgi:hypothetical protein
MLWLLQVSIVKEYVSRQLQMEGKEIAKDRDTISRLQVRSADATRSSLCCSCSRMVTHAVNVKDFVRATVLLCRSRPP